MKHVIQQGILCQRDSGFLNRLTVGIPLYAFRQLLRQNISLSWIIALKTSFLLPFSPRTEAIPVMNFPVLHLRFPIILQHQCISWAFWERDFLNVLPGQAIRNSNNFTNSLISSSWDTYFSDDPFFLGSKDRSYLPLTYFASQSAGSIGSSTVSLRSCEQCHWPRNILDKGFRLSRLKNPTGPS